VTDIFQAKFNISTLEIRLSNGARMIARGMDEACKTKSIKDPRTVWFEEVNELKESAFWDTVLSIRSPHDVPLNVFASFNPGEDCDPDHWLVKTFFEDPDIFQHPEGQFHEVQGKRSDVQILHTTYKDNPYRNPQFDKEMQELKSRDLTKFQMKG
jgi:PBSX family phage terminase large subunit